MDARETELLSGLSRFLSAKWSDPTTVSELDHIAGGASRDTWRCVAQNGANRRHLIVRLDPVASLIDTDRRTEHRAMEVALRAGLPAPQTLFLEEDLGWLGRPFSITTEVLGCKTSPESIPPEQRDALGQQKWTLLGRLAALDLQALDLGEVFKPTTAQTCALEQLDYWRKVIVDDALHPNPIAHAALRWLHRRLPPPAEKLCLVHGDYRTGNFLYSPDGEIKAILDWEMAHIGNPLEDLAWSLDPLWCWQEPERAGRLLPHSQAVACWEQASGLRLDPEAFRWWRIFSAVKALAIWISSSEAFHNGANKSPILAMAGWLFTDRQQRILVDYLSPHSEHRFAETVT